MPEIEINVPLGSDRITEEAAEAMVGQTVRLNAQGRWDDPLGRAVVASAAPTDDGIRMTLDVPQAYYEGMVNRYSTVGATHGFKAPDDLSYGLGFRVDGADRSTVEGIESALFTAVTPFEVSVHAPLRPRTVPSGLPGPSPS